MGNGWQWKCVEATQLTPRTMFVRHELRDPHGMLCRPRIVRRQTGRHVIFWADGAARPFEDEADLRAWMRARRVGPWAGQADPPIPLFAPALA